MYTTKSRVSRIKKFDGDSVVRVLKDSGELDWEEREKKYLVRQSVVRMKEIILFCLKERLICHKSTVLQTVMDHYCRFDDIRTVLINCEHISKRDTAKLVENAHRIYEVFEQACLNSQ